MVLLWVEHGQCKTSIIDMSIQLSAL